MTFNCYMHPRNIYRTRPDFRELASEFPEFSEYAIVDERGRVHINFKDAGTLRCLTKTLLKKDFGLTISIPENCLIPTVPQRLNYILWIEDLLSTLPSTENGSVKGVDVGTGPCCIFSALGATKNGWKFLATESEEVSFKWASKNVTDNNLQGQIKLCKVDQEVILKGAVDNEGEVFDFCMCNPPFFHDLDEMHLRKKGLSAESDEAIEVKPNEVIVQGGEVEFVKKMIRDSVDLKEKIRVYTSMFGKKKSLVGIKHELKNLGNVNYTFTEFCQGNTMRWGVAWTFVKGINLSKVKCSRRKKKKPLNFLIPKSEKGYSIKKMLQRVIAVLQELSIQYEIKKETRLNVLLLVKSNENTWSHQRRKRRQAQKLAKKDVPVQSKFESEVMPDALEVSDMHREVTKSLSGGLTVDYDGSGGMPGVDSSMDSEAPLEGELVRMDTEVQSNSDVEDGSLNLTETESVEAKLTENVDSEVEICTTIPLSEDFSPDLNSSVVGKESDLSQSDSGNGCESLTEGVKRMLDEEDGHERDQKRSKMESSETPNTLSTVSEPSNTKAVPLLLCDLELKRYCDKIMLELSCEEHCNRQSMSEILQLFKNRLK